MVTEIEQKIIDYKENNNRYINSFNSIYESYKEWIESIKECNVKDYIITSTIQLNKITNYSNYTEYCSQYLKALGKGDIEYGEQTYREYYNAFILNMDNELQQLKKRYNKTDEDIHKAYNIKTIWNPYNGFMVEKLIKLKIESEATYTTLAERTVEEQQQIDTQMAIDIEVTAPMTTLGFQIKSYTYLGVKEAKKQKHIKQQKKYKEKYAAEVFYILYKDSKPIYQIKNANSKIPYVSYLFTQKDILELNKKKTAIGSYVGLAKEIDNKIWLKDTIKQTHSKTQK